MNCSSHTSLRRHEQKHQGVHYKCSKCVRLFNDPSNLRRHEASCTGSGDAADNPVDEKPSTSEKAMPNVKVEKKSESKEEVDQMKPHRCGYCKKVKDKIFTPFSRFRRSDNVFFCLFFKKTLVCRATLLDNITCSDRKASLS